MYLKVRFCSAFLIFMAVLSISGFAQLQRDDVAIYIKRIAKGRQDLNQLLLDAKEKQLFGNLLKPIEQIVEDTLEPNNKRVVFYDALSKIGILSDDSTLRKNVLSFLVKENIKNNLYSNTFVNCVSGYKQRDYTDSTKDAVLNLALSHKDSWPIAVRLVGFLNVNGGIYKLENCFLNDSLLTARDRWVFHIALARLGSSSHAEYCLKMAQLAGVNSDVVYGIYPDLVYTRNRVIVDYLVSLLYQDEKGCFAPDPDVEELTPCAYRILELIAPIIENFPIKVGFSGDIEGYEYPVALKIARDWFIKNKNYQIVTTTL